MADLIVNIGITGGEIFEGTVIPDDYTPDQVIAELMDQLNLPGFSEAGLLLNYSLVNLRTKSTLEPKVPLSRADVQNGDELRIVDLSQDDRVVEADAYSHQVHQVDEPPSDRADSEAGANWDWVSAKNKTFRIFISSTFSDLKAERNALQRYVFPRLRELCMRHGRRFQAIDLRWGVSEEAARDQQTMKICLNEIARCQEVTPRPNFIVLLGDRYGWRPLPTEIPADEFDAIKTQVTSETELALLERSYRLDENARYSRSPGDEAVGLYCLQRHEGIDLDGPNRVESELHRILVNAVRSLNLSETERAKYVASATEQEIIRGVMSVPDAEHHVFCFFRSLPLFESKDVTAGVFIDLNDDRSLDVEAHVRLQELRSRLHDRLGQNVHDYEARWSESTESPITLDHIGTLPQDLDDCLLLLDDEPAPALLCVGVWRCLARKILEEISKLENLSLIRIEQEEHDKFGWSRAGMFCGRGQYLDAIYRYVKTRDQQPFALWGDSGSGKSALLARAVEEILKRNRAANLVVRFIGATPQSSDARALLESLCRQISDAYGAEQGTIPSDYNGLAKEFSQRLAFATERHPLILVLDALDQLSDAEHGRNLTWLPAELPEHVRLIVSTTPGECLDALQGKLPAESVMRLEPMPVDEADQVLDLWLDDVGRRLQKEQRQEVLGKFAANGLPLYLKLAFEEARLWHSYDEVPTLADDVPGIVNNLFERLSVEANHGAAMVSRSLGYLAASRNGLAEDEVLAVLSHDPEVMSEFKRRSVKSPEVDELPVVVWSRLYFDLEPYLTERAADDTSLLSFYHRQLGEVAARMFLSGDDGLRAHKHLADYFEGKDYWLESPQQYCDRTGSVPNSARRPNLRKATELAWQLREAGDWVRLELIHTELDFLESKTAAGLIFELAQDFTQALKIIPRERPMHRIVRLLEEAVRRDIHFIARHREDFPQALFQCLWNSCWWYDCPEAARHYEENEGPWSKSGPKLYELLDRWRAVREEDYPGFFWIRSLRPPPVHLGTAQVAVFRGHENVRSAGGVGAVAITTDGRRIVSGAFDNTIRVWDTDTGEELHCLRGHDGSVWSVAISRDGRRIASVGTWDQTVRVWDASTGKELRCLRGHESAVKSVAISSDGLTVVSGSFDRTVRVWNAETGEEMHCLRGHEDRVWSVAISSDGRRIVSAGAEDKTVRLWDAEHGKELLCIRGHEEGVFAVAISRDGRRIFSGSHDMTLRVWDSETGAELQCLRGHQSGVDCLGLSAHHSKIVSGSHDRTVRVWNSESGEEIRCLQGHEGGVNCVAVSSDGRRIVSGSDDRTLRVWSPESGERLRPLRGHVLDVHHVVQSGDGRRIVSGSDDRTIRVWDPQTAEELCSLKGHQDDVWPIAISPDGRKIVSGSSDKTVRIWDIEAKQELHCLVGHQGSVDCLTISNEGRRIVSGSDDRTVRVWDTETGAELFCLAGHTFWVTGVKVSNDGQKIVSVSLDSVRVWNAESGEQLLCVYGDEDNPIRSMLVLSGGSRVAAVSPTTVRVWDIESGRELFCLRGDSNIESVTIPKDEQSIVTVSSDNTLTIWDAESGERTAVHKAKSDAHTFVAKADARRESTSARWDSELGHVVTGERPTTNQFWAVARGLETLIEDIDDQVLALFPTNLFRPIAHPTGRLWTGRDTNYMCFITLEGGPDQTQP